MLASNQDFSHRNDPAKPGTYFMQEKYCQFEKFSSTKISSMSNKKEVITVPKVFTVPLHVSNRFNISWSWFYVNGVCWNDQSIGVV